MALGALHDPADSSLRVRQPPGFNKLELVVNNVRFQDGEPLTDQSDRTAA
jgi:putative transposase